MRSQNRQRDAGKIDPVARAKRRGKFLAALVLEHGARRRLAPPVEEGAFARDVGADRIEARKSPRNPLDKAETDSLGGEERPHRLAVGILAKRGRIVDGDASPAPKSGEIDRGVERIAAKGERGA